MPPLLRSTLRRVGDLTPATVAPAMFRDCVGGMDLRAQVSIGADRIDTGKPESSLAFSRALPSLSPAGLLHQPPLHDHDLVCVPSADNNTKLMSR